MIKYLRDLGREEKDKKKGVTKLQDKYDFFFQILCETV